MKILSLFDGMSVAQQALKDAGIPVEVYYASEIDEYAVAVTQSNFPKTIQLGSVLTVGKFTQPIDFSKSKYLPDIDLLVGGSPCQDLSIAKKDREGLKGQRSGLFYEYVRIRDEVKPKFFILENVASMPKKAKEQISEILGVEPVMINASLVSAQNRKRLFWVGKWNPTIRKYRTVKIPQPEDRRILLKDILEENVDKKYYMNTTQLDKINQSNYIDKKPILIFKEKMGTLKLDGDVKRVVYNEWNNRIMKYKCGTLGTNAGRTAKQGYQVVDGDVVRHLTPTEYLRLQSMPDDYFEKAIYKNKPISNTQRYKMCGNAFNKNVIAHILKNML
jgi:DNA-cytosine methyltransferase